MSQRGRINHIVNALAQSGFYPENEPKKPGEFTPAVLESLQSFMEYKDEEIEKGHNEEGRIKRVLNALRTVESQIFRGIPRNCSKITEDVRDSIKIYIEKMQSTKQFETEIA